KCEATIVVINAIALLRQAILSSPGRNTRAARPESSWENSACGCGEIAGFLVDMVVDDEMFHKLMSMVEKNELFKELMILVMDTEQNLIELDCYQSIQEDLGIFHASYKLYLHIPRVD
ncbi:hypothetical protein Tco_0349881, partial [Tanacetum coccineum]